jgi:hypothetical protein
MTENKKPKGKPPGHPGSDYSVLKESEPHYKALRDGHLLFGPSRPSHIRFLREASRRDGYLTGEKMS